MHPQLSPAPSHGAMVPADGFHANGCNDDPICHSYAGLARMGKHGSDGVMYRGCVREGPRRGQWHALKYRTPGDDPRREIESLHAVSHPNIVKLLEVFEPHCKRKSTVLAFPESDGDLHNFLRCRSGRGPLSSETSRGIAVQLLAALRHMHERCLIHRDVKPGNVLVSFGDEDSCSLRVQLADFSRARRLPSRSAGTRYRVSGKRTMDQHGLAVGHEELLSTRVTTPVFLAPEVALVGEYTGDDARYGTAIDIWAFGAVLYQVLTLKLFIPLGGDGDILDIIRWIVRRIGPNQASTASTEMYKFISSEPDLWACTAGHSVGTHRGHGWPWVRAALVWDANARPSAHQLARAPWNETPEVGSAPAAARGDAVTPDKKRKAPDSAQALGVFSQPSSTTEPLKKVAKSCKCACSGHCYQPGHRYRGGCDCRVIVEYTKFCMACKCAVPGCGKPRLRGTKCYQHGHVKAKLSIELHATSAMQPSVIANMPCDLVDFITHFPRIRSDFLWMTATALFKEPTATDAMMAETGLGTAESFTAAIMRVIDAVDQAPHGSELRSLNRQGVARTTGTGSTLRQWGFLTPADPEDSATAPGRDTADAERLRTLAAAQGPTQRVYRVGLTQKKYLLAPEAEREAAARRLIAAKSAVETQWSELVQGGVDALSFMRQFRSIVRAAAEIAPMMFPRQDNGYVATFVGRKALLAMLAQGDITVDWSKLHREDLEELCCDQNGFLAEFDSSWSAADISNFIFGRPDWGMLVSLFACLWHDAVALKGTSHQALLKDIETGAYERAAAALRSSCDHNVHPAVVVRELLARKCIQAGSLRRASEDVGAEDIPQA